MLAWAAGCGEGGLTVKTRDNRTRAERERDRVLGWVRVLGMIGLAVLVALLVLGAQDVPEPPSVEECRARFYAGERYDEVVDRYGDVVGATQAAELVYRDMMEK